MQETREKGSKKQDAGMLTGKARRIFCDNVTCSGANKCCSNRSHLQECFIKALRFLLAELSVSKRKIQGGFMEGDIRNTPDCLGGNNSHFALENEGWKMSLVFSHCGSQHWFGSKHESTSVRETVNTWGFTKNSANLTAKKSLERTNQVPGNKKFCTAINLKIDTGHKPCK